MAKRWEQWRALIVALLAYFEGGASRQVDDAMEAYVTEALLQTTRGQAFLRRRGGNLEGEIGRAIAALLEDAILTGDATLRSAKMSALALDEYAMKYEHRSPQQPATPALPEQLRAFEESSTLAFFASAELERRQPRNEETIEKDVDVFYVQQSTDKEERPDESAFGKALVKIPRRHRRGKLEQPPFGWTILERKSQHCVIAAHERFSDFESFMGQLSAGESKKQVLVFVHGFNTKPKAAKLRAAQMAADTGFDGRVLAYIWPSAGSKWKYDADRARVPRAADGLATLLSKLLSDGWAIHVLAHSMGSLVAGWALERVCRAESGDVQEVVFAAPDASDTEFDAIVTAIGPRVRRVTLYQSAEDAALMVSALWNHRSPVGLCLVDGLAYTNPSIEAIDASAVWNQFWNLDHAYVFGSYKLITDMKQLLRGAKQTRDMLEETGTPFLWRFPRTT